MNTIYRVQERPYIYDPGDIFNRVYSFPGQRVKGNNNPSFTSNTAPAGLNAREIRQKAEKVRNLITKINSENTNRTRLNALI